MLRLFKLIKKTIGISERKEEIKETKKKDLLDKTKKGSRRKNNNKMMTSLRMPPKDKEEKEETETDKNDACKIFIQIFIKIKNEKIYISMFLLFEFLSFLLYCLF